MGSAVGESRMASSHGSPLFAAEYLVRKRQRPRRHVMSVDVYGRVVDFRVKGLLMGQGSRVIGKE